MEKEGGVYTIPCSVNGLKLRFIFDTGASNVCISLSEATFMLKNGYLDERDIIGLSSSRIADGKLVENTRIILREIEIEGIKLYNIEATVMHNLSAPLLLGQSAIQQLGKIELNGDELLIFNGTTTIQKNTANFDYNLQSRWRVMYEGEDCKSELDLKSIARIEGNMFKYWYRLTNLSENEKKKYGSWIGYFAKKEWEKIDLILELIVVDCEGNRHAVLEWVVKDAKGTVLKSRSDTGNLSWASIAPESIREAIKDICCY
jgi:clan AA aspartic protease (TIGR02281 family)